MVNNTSSIHAQSFAFVFEKSILGLTMHSFPISPCQAAADSILSGLKRANRKKGNSSDKDKSANGKGKAKAKAKK
jgi:hypothetical protein